MTHISYEALLEALGGDTTFSQEDKDKIQQFRSKGFNIYEAVDNVTVTKILCRIKELVTKIEKE